MAEPTGSRAVHAARSGRGCGRVDRVRTTAVLVVYDVECPDCSEIARELPGLLRVPVTVYSCRERRLATRYPTAPAAIRSCANPAIGTMRRDGTVRWWPGLRGAAGLAPLLRPRSVGTAMRLLWDVLAVHRARAAGRPGC